MCHFYYNDCPYFRLPDISPTLRLIYALNNSTRREYALRLVTCIPHEKCNNPMRRDAVCRETSDSCAILCVSPEILARISISTIAYVHGKCLITLTEYRRPAAIQGDSTKLKNIFAGTSRTLSYAVVKVRPTNSLTCNAPT